VQYSRAKPHVASGKEFDEAIGSAGTASPEQLRYALWIASELLAAASRDTSKRVMVFTRDAQPDGGNLQSR
jgi:hypothetical protein